MDVFQLLRPLLPLVIIAIVLLVSLSRTATRRSALRKKFAKQFQGATAIDAICANEGDLAGQPRQLVQAARGFVLLGTNSDPWFVGARFSAEESLQLERAKGWRLRFLPSNPIALGVPDLIRVANADHVHFLIGVGAFGQPSKTQTKRLYAELLRRLDRAGSESPPSANSPLLIMALGLVLIVVGAMIFGALQRTKLLGPQVLARGPGGSVLAATDDALLRFSADGTELNATPWSSLGFNDGVSGLRSLPDGSLLVGDFANGVISRCPSDGGQCAPLPAFAAGKFQFRGAFSFEIDPAGEILFASDSGRHRMLTFAVGGGPLEEYRGEERALCYPNTIRMLDDGRLLVADTNNFRILEWPSAKRWPEPAPTEHSTVAETPSQYGCNPNDREGKGNAHLDRMRDYRIVGHAQPFAGLKRNSVWVAQFDRGSDGRWWVVFNGDNVRRGDVGILDADWRFQKALTLPAHADPWDVLAFGDGALIADPVASKIYRFNSRGLQISDFAGQALASYLAPALRRKAFYDTLRFAAPAALALLVLPLVPIGLYVRKRRVREILALPKP